MGVLLATATVFLAGLLCVPARVDAALSTTLYVAPDGRDEWSGRSAAPNRKRTDGPFATLERARDEIRKLKAAGALSAGGVTVELRGGLYQRAAPFKLAARDSGSDDAPVVYRAYPGEQPRLVGGKVVKDFVPVTDPAILARLDEAARATAITIRGGARNQVVGCTVRNVGGCAVSVTGGTANGVVGCDIYGAGQGGISLEGGDRTTLTPAQHLAENNHIHHYGRWNRMYHPAVAVRGVGMRVAHNLIHDAPHMAIFFSGNDHLIELNEIHDVCTESNDAGAIYAGRDWTMRGAVIRYNFLHHISGFEGRGCVGVYLDDMWCGTLIQGNIFYRVTRAAFIGGGRDNTIENNIFVECDPAVHVDARALGWAKECADTTMMERLAAVPYRQPPWSEHYPRLVNILADAPPAPKGNVVARNICWGGQWEEIEEAARPLTAFEANLVGQDPHFVDPEHLDFRLRDDSPAYEIGFERLPAGGGQVPVEENGRDFL